MALERHEIRSMKESPAVQTLGFEIAGILDKYRGYPVTGEKLREVYLDNDGDEIDLGQALTEIIETRIEIIHDIVDSLDPDHPDDIKEINKLNRKERLLSSLRNELESLADKGGKKQLVRKFKIIDNESNIGAVRAIANVFKKPTKMTFDQLFMMIMEIPSIAAASEMVSIVKKAAQESVNAEINYDLQSIYARKAQFRKLEGYATQMRNSFSKNSLEASTNEVDQSYISEGVNFNNYNIPITLNDRFEIELSKRDDKLLQTIFPEQNKSQLRNSLESLYPWPEFRNFQQNIDNLSDRQNQILTQSTGLGQALQTFGNDLTSYESTAKIYTQKLAALQKANAELTTANNKINAIKNPNDPEKSKLLSQLSDLNLSKTLFEEELKGVEQDYNNFKQRLIQKTKSISQGLEQIISVNKAIPQITPQIGQAIEQELQPNTGAIAAFREITSNFNNYRAAINDLQNPVNEFVSDVQTLQQTQDPTIFEKFLKNQIQPKIQLFSNLKIIVPGSGERQVSAEEFYRHTVTQINAYTQFKLNEANQLLGQPHIHLTDFIRKVLKDYYEVDDRAELDDLSQNIINLAEAKKDELTGEQFEYARELFENNYFHIWTEYGSLARKMKVDGQIAYPTQNVKNAWVRLLSALKITDTDYLDLALMLEEHHENQTPGDRNDFVNDLLNRLHNDNSISSKQKKQLFNLYQKNRSEKKYSNITQRELEFKKANVWSKISLATDPVSMTGWGLLAGAGAAVLTGSVVVSGGAALAVAALAGGIHLHARKQVNRYDENNR